MLCRHIGDCIIPIIGGLLQTRCRRKLGIVDACIGYQKSWMHAVAGLVSGQGKSYYVGGGPCHADITCVVVRIPRLHFAAQRCSAARDRNFLEVGANFF